MLVNTLKITVTMTIAIKMLASWRLEKMPKQLKVGDPWTVLRRREKSLISTSLPRQRKIKRRAHARADSTQILPPGVRRCAGTPPNRCRAGYCSRLCSRWNITKSFREARIDADAVITDQSNQSLSGAGSRYGRRHVAVRVLGAFRSNSGQLPQLDAVAHDRRHGSWVTSAALSWITNCNPTASDPNQFAVRRREFFPCCSPGNRSIGR